MKKKITSNESETRRPAESLVSGTNHPSRNLRPRAKGYGIGGGYERPYRARTQASDQKGESYGPVPHSGYYGAGAGAERFEVGQAGFNKELSWYSSQYGESTSGQSKGRR